MVALISALKQRIVPPGRHPVKVKSGSFRGITLDLDLTWQIQVYLGLYEREVYQWLERYSVGVQTAIDIGAADGAYTLYFLAKTDAQQVIAFEPLESGRALLDRNLQLNGLASTPRLKVHNKLVGSVPRGEQVPLDSIASNITLPCLIKMDVEGAEADVLRGATQLMARRGVRWIIETHAKDVEDECIHLLRQSGYDTFIVPNAPWRVVIPEGRPIAHNRWLAASNDNA